jgi:hypothetical protein
MTSGERVLTASAEVDELRTQLALLWRLGKATPADTVVLSRAIAAECVRLERYPV